MNLVFILRKNLFPVHLIDKCVYRYLNTAIDRYGSTQTPPSSNATLQGDVTKVNYRPISILPCVSKIFERIIYNQLYNYFVSRRLLSDSLSGS